MNEEVCRILLGIQESISLAVLPSAIYKPELRFLECLDNGPCWSASYGDFYATGKSPAEAMREFDNKWYVNTKEITDQVVA